LERWPSLEKLQRQAVYDRAVLHRSQQPRSRPHQGAAGADSQGSSGDHGLRGGHIVECRRAGLGGPAEASFSGNHRL
jgi:hypothetical protein